MTQSLQPLEQRTILFYEDEITAVLVEQEGRQVVYVPIRPICDFMGLNWSGQRQRIERDASLAHWRHITHLVSHKSVGKFVNGDTKHERNKKGQDAVNIW